MLGVGVWYFSRVTRVLCIATQQLFMTPTRSGSFRLFRLAGIDVYLHWSWFLIAVFRISDRHYNYSSIVWNIAEYLSLFLIVLMHEFGHSLACRQVGGEANQIVLWPLGGVAYVNPPQRPGATLWSIAAGPLVNVVLAPILFGLYFLCSHLGLESSMPDLVLLFRNVLVVDLILLVFNLMPVYPLDGGQILCSLLWFAVGRARALMVTTIIGFIGVAGLAVLALLEESVWMGIMAAYVGMSCWSGFQQSRALMRIDKLPRHSGMACPDCKSAPPAGSFWRCGSCQSPFDMFLTLGKCPGCAAKFDVAACPHCGKSFPIGSWMPNNTWTS